MPILEQGAKKGWSEMQDNKSVPKIWKAFRAFSCILPSGAGILQFKPIKNRSNC
jgi:hypothetical protein